MNYVLYGEEQYLIKQAQLNIVKKYVKEHQDLATVEYNATTTSIQEIIEDASTIPFFTETKIILVHHANFLSANNDTEIDIQVLQAYLEQPLETTVLILIGEFAKLDARKKIVKKVKETCEILHFPKLDEQGKQVFVNEQLRIRGISIDKRGREELYKRLPFDISTIYMELDKVALYGGDISYDVISNLVRKPLEEDVFQLVHAVVAKDVKKAFHTWQDLCVLNKDAIYMIALLASQFRFLYEVKALMMKSKGKEEIVSILAAHPFRVQKTMESAHALSLRYLMRILSQLATLDQRFKAGLVDKKLGFEMFLLSIKGG